MDRQEKDNLTDLVEQLPRPGTSTPPPQTEQQVVNSEGQVITLGHEKPKTIVIKTNKNSLELPVAELLKTVARAVEEAIRSFTKQ